MQSAVVIAGGGPAGLMLACELGLAGVPSTVIERRTAAATSSCGMVLHARSVEVLAQRGLADRFRVDETPTWPRTHFGLLWLNKTGPADNEYLVPQWRTEQLLAERAAELGVDIRRGHQVTSASQDGSGVSVGIRSDQGDEHLRCAYLVGCDGVNSAVARLGQFDFEVFGPPYYGVLADVPVSPDDPPQFASGLYPAGQFGVLPIKPDEVRLMTLEFVGEPPGDEVPVTHEEVRASIRRITGTEPDFAEPQWTARFGHATRLVRRYRHGRVLLAGDAAHAHPHPAGHGLNTAIHDAVNLGWKLAATVHGWAPPELLDTYHEERHPVGRRACLSARAQMSLMYPADQAAPLREIFSDLIRFGEVNRYLLDRVTRVRYPIGVPPDGNGPTRADPIPPVGERIPDVALSTKDGPSRATDLLRAGRGLVLDLSGDSSRLSDLGEWADRMDVVRAGPVPQVEASTLLIRPDGHVAWADRDGNDHSGLLSAVRTWFGEPASLR